MKIASVKKKSPSKANGIPKTSPHWPMKSGHNKPNWNDNIVPVTPGWSEAYGLFLEGEADMVLSYTTSPAYHLIAEEDAGYTAAAFDEGH